MAEVRINRFDGGIAQSIHEQAANKAAHVKHFDIFRDPHRLIPMPDFQTQNGTANLAKNYRFKALGGSPSTVYALGYYSSWYNASWSHRIELTVPALASGSLTDVPVYLSLNGLGATFWSTVKSDGGDIRVTSSDGFTEVPIDLVSITTGSQTGHLFFKAPSLTTTASTFYVYFGNVAASGYAAGATYGANNAYGTDRVSISHLEGGATGKLGAATDFGSSIAGPSGWGISTFTISAWIQADSVSSTRTIAAYAGLNGTTQSGWHLYLSGGTLHFQIRTNTVNSLIAPGGTALSTGTWYHVMAVTTPASSQIYLNGILEVSVGGSGGAIYFNSTYDTPMIGASPSGLFGAFDGRIDEVQMFSSQKGASYMPYSYANQNGNVTAGSAMTKADISYTGTGLWQKSHNATDWSIISNSNGSQVGTTSHYPTSGFIDEIGNSTYAFTVSQDVNEGGFWYVATAKGSTNTITPDDELLSTLSEKLPTLIRGKDNNWYANNMSDKLHQVTTTPGVTADVYDAGKSIWSMALKDNYLAIFTESNSKSILELWDYVNDDPISVIDLGDGEARVGGTVDGTLLAISDVDLDTTRAIRGDGYLSFKGVMGDGAQEFLRIYGNGQITPADTKDLALLPWAYSSENRLHFYAKIPTATGYNEGIWTVGKNSQGQIAVAQLLDTSSLGRVNYVWGARQDVYFIHNSDGSISRLNHADSYTLTSEYETIAFAPTQYEDCELSGVTLYTEPLPAGATVAASYKTDNMTSYTQIFTDSTDDITKREATLVEGDGMHFNNFKSIQFKITSTGGAVVTGFKFEYQPLSPGY